MRLFFQLQDADAEFMALRGQDRCINQHTVALDAVQRLAALDFQLINEAQFGIHLQLRPQRAVDIECHVRVFARIFSRFHNLDLVKTDLVGALAAQVFKTEAAAPQMAFGQAGQAVRFGDFKHITL